jgi:hypothetical protein
MPEPEESERLLRAVQRSQRLAAAGTILGILPPLLVLALSFSFLWIEPLLPFWSACQSFTCSPLGYLVVFVPGVLVALAAISCGYRGIRHWPRYPTEALMWFNLSLALGMLWACLFWIIMMTGMYLLAS